jgi:hypothetical protein
MKHFSMTCAAMQVSLLSAIFLSKECHNHLLLSVLSGENESEAKP